MSSWKERYQSCLRKLVDISDERIMISAELSKEIKQPDCNSCVSPKGYPPIIVSWKENKKKHSQTFEFSEFMKLIELAALDNE